MHHAIEEEEEAHIPFKSLLYVRNPMKCDMEEEALILLESLELSIKSSMQHDIKDHEAHLSFTFFAIYVTNPMNCDMEEEACIL
jgi:hypothetical protein